MEKIIAGREAHSKNLFDKPKKRRGNTSKKKLARMTK